MIIAVALERLHYDRVRHGEEQSSGGTPLLRRLGAIDLVALGLVVVAALIDRFVLLPTFEAGGGSHGAAVASWLVVNLMPAIVTAAIWRRMSRAWARSLGQALTVALFTGIGILVALVMYMGSGDWN